MNKNTDNYYAVILAGGSGTRFWPLSRAAYPKQFLKIIGNTSLLQQTVERIKGLIKPSHIYIVTNKDQAKNVVKQLKGTGVKQANILREPSGKNTAPAILWACTTILKKNKDAIFAVLPSDHLITKKQKYLKCLREGFALAARKHLVTFGIQPTRPDTGFGYLKTVKDKGLKGSAVSVKQFKEKPSLAVAQKYVQSKDYFWNSGMFVWHCQTLMEKYKVHARKIHTLIGAHNNQKAIAQNWKKLPSISVDYAILEKDQDVVAVVAKDIGWSDLGSWDSLIEVLSDKKNQNITKGDVLVHNARNNYVYSSEKLIAISDVDNLIVVDTPDALLICRKDQSQNVKVVVENLKKRKRKEV